MLKSVKKSKDVKKVKKGKILGKVKKMLKMLKKVNKMLGNVKRRLKTIKIQKCYGRTDGPTYRPTEQGVESRARD